MDSQRIPSIQRRVTRLTRIAGVLWCFLSLLSRIFKEHRTVSSKAFRLMNGTTPDCFSLNAYCTEIFPSHTLSRMIKEIERIRDERPEAGYSIISNAPKWFEWSSWKPRGWDIGLIIPHTEATKSLGTFISAHRKEENAWLETLRSPYKSAKFVQIKISLRFRDEVLPAYTTGPVVENAWLVRQRP
jgi:hypothetical protein